MPAVGPQMSVNHRPPPSPSLAAGILDLVHLRQRQHQPNDETIDLLHDVAETARLLHATAKLHALFHRDAAMPGSFLEIAQMVDGTAQLRGEGGRLITMLEVKQLTDVRLMCGLTEIKARVDMIDDKKYKKQKGMIRSREPIQLHFEFTRRLGPQKGSSLPYYAEETADNDQPRQRIKTQQQRRKDRYNAAAAAAAAAARAPTTIIEYVISATNRAAEPVVELLRVVILGMSSDGTPSANGVEMEQQDDDDDTAGEKRRQEERKKQEKDLCVCCDVDGEALEAVMDWCGTSWSQPEFLMFLLMFPYHEEEWDVNGIVLDQVLGFDDEGSEDEGEEEEEEQPRQPRGKTKARQKETQNYKQDKGKAAKNIHEAAPPSSLKPHMSKRAKVN